MSRILGLPRAGWLWGSVAMAIVGLAIGGALIFQRGGHEASGERPPAIVERLHPSRGPQPASGILLTDMTATSGVTFRHDDGGSGEMYLVESVTAGLALFDYDGDGLIDIYFVNGAPLPPRKADPTITNALYRNEGDFRFPT